MPVNLKKRNKKRAKKVISYVRFQKLIVSRPDVLHGYLRHEEINRYLEYLMHRYSFVQVHLLGLTHERRQLKAIEIDWNSVKNLETIERERTQRPLFSKPTTAPSPQQNVQLDTQARNTIFIEGGTHAREWMSVAVALNCIYQLTEKHLRNYELLRKLRFIIVPVTNPDGYEYTFVKNRRWRKNRRPIRHSRHIGTDCNRNYDFHWEDGPSKSGRNTFKGVKPFSEPETRAMRNALRKHKDNLLFFLSLHSYAESIMYPWGYSKELPETWQKLEKLALAGRNAIKAYNGRNYRVGSIAKLTKRRISGSIVDYVFGVINVPLALVMELPSHALGFQPPAESISPIGHESWFGIREMCKMAYDIEPHFSKLEETFLASIKPAILEGGDTSNRQLSYKETTPPKALTSVKPTLPEGGPKSDREPLYKETTLPKALTNVKPALPEGGAKGDREPLYKETTLPKVLTSVKPTLPEGGAKGDKQPSYKAIMPAVKADEALKSRQVPVKC